MGGDGWFRRVGSSRGGSENDGERERRRRLPGWLRRLGSVFSASGWRWKRAEVRFGLVDRMVFYLLYVVEAAVLVAGLGFFLCCFGCRV